MLYQGNLLSKTLVIGIIFLFVVMSIIPSVAIDTIQQSSMPISNGKTLYVGGSGHNNYTKIQDAIDNASDGDTVYVYDDSSPYYEGVEIDKSINLIGENRETTVIDGNESEFDVVLINADWVNMSGFTIQNSGNFEHAAGIYFFWSWFCNVTDNIITSNNGSGILLSRGMGGFYSCYNLISDNIISLNKYNGIYLYDVWGNNIIGNIISNNNNGIYTIADLNGPCYENIIFGNTIISNNDSGIKLEEYSIDNNITCNTISNNGYGVTLIAQLFYGGNNVFNNTITDNEYSIILYSSDSNNIKGNTIMDNYAGIYLYSSSNNAIYHNNLINNSHNAYDNAYNIWDNGYSSGGNFWDDYNGTDSDGDGIGDTPYPIPGGNNKDRYPLGNFHPDKPDIDGPGSGKPGIEYEYTFNSTDPENEPVMYFIDWGDNTTEWTEYSDSGEEIMLKHNWSKIGDYTIKAKAKDIYDSESNWSEFEVEIPRNRATTNSLFQLFFNRFPLLEVFLRAMNLLR